jgi:hypothetical protein
MIEKPMASGMRARGDHQPGQEITTDFGCAAEPLGLDAVEH